MSLVQQPLAGMQPYEKPASRPTYVDLLQVALTNNGAIEVIKELAALEKDANARKAEVAFNEAMNEVQSEVERAVPDAVNAQKKKFASYAALDKAVRPVYTKHGFSLSFNTAPVTKGNGEISAELLRVQCYVSHRDGHTRPYEIVIPADGKGAQGGAVMSATHAVGAASSYGMRYLLKMIFNIAIGEEELTNEWLINELKAMENAKTFEMLRQIHQSAYNQAKEEKNGNAMLALAQAYDKYKAKLQ